MQELIDGLTRMRAASLDGMAAGLDGVTPAITERMRATTAHGDQTGATRASYQARRVGRGQDGAAAFATAYQAADERNPGKAVTSSVAVDGEIGVIIDSATTYQDKLETERAGARAVLGPTLQAESRALTAAAADGSRKALT